MQNDAKLGLLAGLAATLVVAVVYFQKPGAAATPAPAKAAVAGAGNAPPTVPPAAVKVPTRPAATAGKPWDED